jgi:DNA-binding winged helix-turn-helix (wHTH) protein
VASHNELARTVWNGRPVSPETISQRVKLLRDAIRATSAWRRNDFAKRSNGRLPT